MTLERVFESESVRSKGLADNEHDDKVKKIFTSSSMLLVVNELPVQLDRALGIL
jgi:hypothetical protein